jgi:aminoglycoside phosphotransferase
MCRSRVFKIALWVFSNKQKTPSSEMHLTASDVLSGLPTEWQAYMVENELIPVTSGMGGAYVFRIPDRRAGDQYLKGGIGTNADQLRREGARTKWLA